MYRLRELERKDIPIINKWRNNPALIEKLGAPFRFINEDVDNLWFDSYMKNRNNSVRCAIVQDESDEIIGLVSLLKIDCINQSAEFNIMIGDTQYQGKGAGTFAARAILEHAFYNLNLHRVELSVLQSNTVAQHLYEKVGFVKEGVKRQANFKNGHFVDMVLYSLLRDEYTCENIRGGGYK